MFITQVLLRGCYTSVALKHTINGLCFQTYGNDPKFSDRFLLANSADLDQTAPTGAV